MTFKILSLFRCDIKTPTNGHPYFTGFRSLTFNKLKKTNFVFKQWWRVGLFRSDRFWFDKNNFTWGEFPSYKYNIK